jgi:hypothetical protein
MPIVCKTKEQCDRDITPEMIARARAVRDEDIDYSDIPALTDDELNAPGWRRGLFYTAATGKPLPPEIVAWNQAQEERERQARSANSVPALPIAEKMPRSHRCESAPA